MSTNEKVTIGGTTLPAQLGTAILLRSMGEKEMLVLWDTYQKSRKINIVTRRSSVSPTDLQYKIASMKRAGKTFQEVAREFGVNNSVVNNALIRVSVWEYLH